MTVATTTETVPVVTGIDGVIRVGETRVTLDTVIAAFLDGATEEDGDPVVSPARIAADPPAQAGAHGDGGVRGVAGQVMCFRLQLSWRLADAAFAR